MLALFAGGIKFHLNWVCENLSSGVVWRELLDMYNVHLIRHTWYAHLEMLGMDILQTNVSLLLQPSLVYFQHAAFHGLKVVATLLIANL